MVEMLADTSGNDGGRGAVDVHAHIMPPDLRSPDASDPRWPTLARDEAGSERIMLGDEVFRTVRAPLWQLETRVEELDRAGIQLQVVSPVPITLTYWAEPDLAAEYTRQMNDGIAAQVAASCGRLAGLGSVPLQDVPAAIAELERVVGSLGLRGVEIGTRVNGQELDSAELRPFFEAAQALSALIFVHPLGGGEGAIRRSGQPYDFGLGMLTDTAMAAGALVFGGVLAQCPDLRVGLAHGCGTFPWAFPRLELGARLADGEVDSDHRALARRLWVDSLVFDPFHLGLLIERFGEDHVMIGTDYPFVAGQLEGSQQLVHEASSAAILSPTQADLIIEHNAWMFLGENKDVRDVSH